MPFPSSPAATRLPLISLLCCVFNLIASVLVLLGWLAGIPALFQPFAGAAPVVPLSALTVLFATAALINIALVQSGSTLGNLKSARWLSLAVIAIALVVLGEYLLSLEAGLELVLLHARVVAVVQDTSFPGRLSPQAAIAVLVFGAALYGMSRPDGHAARASGWWIALGMLVPGMALVGHFVKARVFYTVAGFSDVAMALPTAVMLLILGAGALALADPQPAPLPKPAGPTGPRA